MANYSTGLRALLLSQGVVAFTTPATELLICGGVMPASADHPASNILSVISLPLQALQPDTTESSRVKSLDIWQGEVLSSGLASWARLRRVGDQNVLSLTSLRLDLTVGVASDSPEVTLNNIQLVKGSSVEIQSVFGNLKDQS